MFLFRQAASRILDTLFPPRCFACNRLTAEQGSLCAGCWRDVEFITPPLCQCCGLPFASATEAAERCVDCLLSPPAYASARAVFRYTAGSRRLISGYKYHDRTTATPMFARWLARAGAEQLAAAEVIVPVPLHRWRLLWRRYNQSALLAQGLGKVAGLPVSPFALRRVRATPQQVGLSRAQRKENMRGAFHVPARQARDIRGKAVLLVDDVQTTGATMAACNEALLAAGAATVYILTLARAVEEDA